MQYHIQTLVKHLFDKDSFEQVTAEELKQFTEDYPYAAVGQFLYAKKLKEAGSYNHYEQSEQACLYFNNAIWLRYILDKKEEAPALSARRDELAQAGFRIVAQTPKTDDQPATEAAANGIEALSDPDASHEEAMVAEASSPVYKTETVPEQDAINEVAEEQPVEDNQEATTPVEEQKAPAETEAVSAVAIAEISQLAEENKAEAAVNAVSITEDALIPPAATTEETDAAANAGAAAPEAPIAGEPVVSEETAPVEEITPQEEVALPEAVAEHQLEEISPETASPVAPAAEAELAAVTAETADNTPEAPVASEEAAPAAAEAEQAPPHPGVFTPASQEAKTAVDLGEPIFESYHTIDYFASQGIKLQQEDFKDRLGKQLKSFTDWLRSMKRIGPIESSTSLDEITNQSIQRIAEHSVEEKEVLTEAMAEVWIKQGHLDKAIRVYEKLSLLNPSKSPYFAGRIEQLKAS